MLTFWYSCRRASIVAQLRKLRQLISGCRQSPLCGFKLGLHLDFGSPRDLIVSNAEEFSPALDRTAGFWRVGRCDTLDRR
jgi:hypothetical protein